MRRWEARLARLEAFVREHQRWLEGRLRRAQLERKWMRILAPQLAPAAMNRSLCRPEAQPNDPTLRQGPVATPGPSPAGSGRQEEAPGPSPGAPGFARQDEAQSSPPPAPVLSPPPALPPPPPPPLVEFIDRGGGMSIAIDTRTGQMADSATVMAALARMPREPAEG